MVRSKILILTFMVMIGGGVLLAPSFDKTNQIQEEESLNIAEYQDVKNRFSINVFEINEEYSILENGIKIEPDEGNNLKEIFDTSDLIGYNKEYVYIQTYEQGYMNISRINLLTKEISKDVYTCEAQMFSYAFHVKDNILYFGESELQKDGLLKNKIKYVNFNERMPRERILFEEITNTRLEVGYFEEYLLVNYSKANNYIMGYIPYVEQAFIDIITRQYDLKDGYLYTGEIPVYGGGDAEGIYFQMLSYNDEMFDFEGTQTLHYFSMKKKKANPVLILSDKTTYVNGSKDYIVLNDYAVDSSNRTTGKIISVKDKTRHYIPETSQVNGIRDSSIQGDMIYINTLHNIYVYDCKNKEYASMDFSGAGWRTIRMHDNTFGVLNMAGEFLEFNLISYNNS